METITQKPIRVKVKHRHVVAICFVMVVSVLCGYFLGPRVKVNDEGIVLTAPELPADVKSVDSWLKKRAQETSKLRPGLESFVAWADPEEKTQTDLSIIYFHGFSASPKEISPTMEELAGILGANIYLPRFRGHGQDSDALGTVKAEDWLQDAWEAYNVAKLLGKKVSVVGTSTGATVAVWLAEQKQVELERLVLMSPNFGAADPRSEWLLLPWPNVFLKLFVGNYSQFNPSTPLQAERWTTRYPSPVLAQVMGLVDFVRKSPIESIHIPCAAIINEKDDVLNVDAMKKGFERLGCRSKQVYFMDHYPKHVPSGDAVASREQTLKIEKKLSEFLVGQN